MQGSGRRSGCPWSRVCRMAPASGRAQWRSRASGTRSKAMQGSGRRSGCPWSRVSRLAPASGRAQWPSAPGERDSDLSGDRGRAVPRSKAMHGQRQAIGLPVVKGVPDGASVGPCSIVARSAGLCVVSIEEGSRKANRLPASGRARWPSAPGERDADHRQPIGLPVVKSVPDGAGGGPCSVAIAGERCQGRRRCRAAAGDRVARGQGCAGWRPLRGVLSGDRGRAVPRSKAMQITGSRSGCPWSRACRMAPASGRAQWPSRASGAKVEGDAGQRQPIGLPVVKGVPDGARFGPCSIVARSAGSAWSRLRKAPARRTGYQRRAAIGGHRRQAKAMQISVAIAGERFPGERDADHRQPIGLPVVKGVPAGARFGPCSVAIGTRRTRFRSQWPSRASGGKVEGDAGQRQAIGLPVVKGVPDGARVGPCSVAIGTRPNAIQISVAIAGERCQGRR
jgi:hypothetical protein